MADDKKIATLLHCAESQVHRTYNNFAKGVKSYSKALDCLDSLFGFRITTTALRYELRKREQRKGEFFHDYYSELKEIIMDCEYGACEQEIICDQIVYGVEDVKLQEKLLATEKLTLKIAIRIALAHELTCRYENKIELKQGSAAVTAFRNKSERYKSELLRSCFRCGSFKHLANFKECSTLSKTCLKCGRLGHFKAYCKTRKENVNYVKFKENKNFIYKKINLLIFYLIH